MKSVFPHSLIFALLGTATALAAATPLPAPARAEVDQLLAALSSSGCEFNRNGAWYQGAEAKTHLLKKLAYIEERGSIQTTEQFIELAGSKSSLTGQNYQVRCPGSPAIDSKSWLSSRLQSVRSVLNAPHDDVK
jgi:hypothetical protein